MWLYTLVPKPYFQYKINVQICFWSPSYKSLILSVRTSVLQHQRTNITFFCLVSFFVSCLSFFLLFHPFCIFCLLFRIQFVTHCLFSCLFLAGHTYMSYKERPARLVPLLRHAMKGIQYDSFKNVPFLRKASCRNAFNPVLEILEKAEFPNPYNGDVLASSIALTLIIVLYNGRI